MRFHTTLRGFGGNDTGIEVPEGGEEIDVEVVVASLRDGKTRP
jgi:hypothetical protein